jgi:hypothetical protein
MEVAHSVLEEALDRAERASSRVRARRAHLRWAGKH